MPKITFHDSKFDGIPADVILKAVVSSIKERVSSTSGQPYYLWEFALQDPQVRNRRVWDRTSLQPQAIWRLKQVLEAVLGRELPPGEFDLNPDEFIGKQCCIRVTYTDYCGISEPRVEVLSADAACSEGAASPTRSLFPRA